MSASGFPSSRVDLYLAGITPITFMITSEQTLWSRFVRECSPKPEATSDFVLPPNGSTTGPNRPFARAVLVRAADASARWEYRARPTRREPPREWEGVPPARSTRQESPDRREPGRRLRPYSYGKLRRSTQAQNTQYRKTRRPN